MASTREEFDEMESDSSSEDSDEELRRAFSAGKLKVGLNKAGNETRAQVKRQPYNNVDGIKHKLKQITSEVEWIEKMDITCDVPEEKSAHADNNTKTKNQDTSVHDDFKREMKFYRQAQLAVQEALPRLQKLGVLTQRPEDYFAEMVKTDEHMQRVRAKLLSKQQAMERAEKGKKLREMKKFGKKVQQEVLQKRQKEKKEMIESVKKFRKGKQKAPDFIKGDDDFNVNTEKSKGRSMNRGKSHKRKAKDAKFGFGGKKRGVKRNSSDSAKDMSSFNSSKHSKTPKAFRKQGKRKTNNRPGKARRAKMRKKK